MTVHYTYQGTIWRKATLLFFTNNYLYFSSELNSLKNITSIDYSLDFNSIQHQLNFSYIPNDASIYKNIKQITQAVKFSLKHNNILISKLFEYWNTYNEIIT